MTYSQMNDMSDPMLEQLCAEAEQLSASIEKERHVPHEFARRLADAGLFKLHAPQELGGSTLGLSQSVQRIERLARADASCAWVALISSSSCISAGYLPTKVAQEIFGDKQVIASGVVAPFGRAVWDDGEYIVNGSWPWGSGSNNADWFVMGVLVEREDQEREHRLVMIPRKQVKILDTWYSLGLAGSSSNDLAIEDVRVSASRSYIVGSAPICQEPVYKLPYFGFLGIAVGSAIIGNARGALDDIHTLAGVRRGQGQTRTMAAKGTVQKAIAEAEAQWRSARAYLYSAIDEAVRQAESCEDTTISPEHAADLRLAITHASRSCLKVVRTCHDLAGGTSVYSTNDIQRRMRDAETMSQHILVNVDTYELLGKVMLGYHHPKMQL